MNVAAGAVKIANQQPYATCKGIDGKVEHSGVTTGR